MEMSSGVVSRPSPCVSGAAGTDGLRRGPFLLCRIAVSKGVAAVGVKNREDCAGSGRFRGVLMSGYRDGGHLEYYRGGSDCGVRKKDEVKKIKEKLKLLEGLTEGKGSSVLAGVEVREGQGMLISEAAEVLMKQLKQLKAEEKDLKRKRKEEKAKIKAERMKAMMDSDSSSSSESSDSECDKVIDMSGLQNKAPEQTIPNESEPICTQVATLCATSIPTQEENMLRDNDAESQAISIRIEHCSATTSSPSCNEANDVLTKKIEVCLGGKCKKSGGPALLEEFNRVVGLEGAVVGCKCMGKCKSGPNVRISNSSSEIQIPELDDSIRTPANPLYIGVGLEDVDLIVANFLGNERELGLSSAA